jgi:LDH2 family malate/lactate/ureidoglycolate dehydrogenase
LVDFLGGALTEAGCSSSEEYISQGGGNGTFIIVINVNHFTSINDFKKRTDEVINNIKNSRKRDDVDEILIPGEPEKNNTEKRLAEGIYISETTWDSIVNIAQEYGLDVKDFVKIITSD